MCIRHLFMLFGEKKLVNSRHNSRCRLSIWHGYFLHGPSEVGEGGRRGRCTLSPDLAQLGSAVGQEHSMTDICENIAFHRSRTWSVKLQTCFKLITWFSKCQSKPSQIFTVKSSAWCQFNAFFFKCVVQF